MPDVVISIVAVVIVLGIMILVHEWGHFVAAKAFGVRVEVFSVGFGPRLWGRRRGSTDYRVSALPLGGYVKMAGDNPSEERAGTADEFLSKPRWQRMLIVVAGPAMNILMAILLTSGLFMTGTSQPVYVDSPAEIAGVVRNSPAEKAGLRAGDRVAEINGVQDPTWEQVLFEMLLTSPGTNLSVVVDRAGERVPVTVQTIAARTSRDEFALLGYPAEPVLVDRVNRGMPADVSGLKAGDEILAMNQEKLASPVQFAALLQEVGGKPSELLVRRGEQQVRLTVRPIFGDPGDGNPRWQIGIAFRFATVEKSYGLTGAVLRSFWFHYRLTRQIVTLVGQLVQRKASLKQIGGPVEIARQSGQAAKRGPLDLINLMAVISLNLGILNLLPIPILDGGHVLLLTVEGMLRRDLSVTVKERIVQVGLVFLLFIFGIVMYNDVLKLLPNR